MYIQEASGSGISRNASASEVATKQELLALCSFFTPLMCMKRALILDMLKISGPSEMSVTRPSVTGTRTDASCGSGRLNAAKAN